MEGIEVCRVREYTDSMWSPKLHLVKRFDSVSGLSLSPLQGKQGLGFSGLRFYLHPNDNFGHPDMDFTFRTNSQTIVIKKKSKKPPPTVVITDILFPTKWMNNGKVNKIMKVSTHLPKPYK